MIITSELAQPIIEQISKVVGHNINIMNNKGVIVASSDSERINQVHQGAVEVMKMKSERVIYPSEIGKLNGTKPGVNLPTFFQQECIGTIGITGDPNEVYNIARIVKITVESLLQQNYLSNQLGYKRKVLEEWALDLINPKFTNYSDLEERSRFLKIDTKQECAIFLLDTGDLSQNNDTYLKISKKQDRILQLISVHFNPLFITLISKSKLFLAFPTNSNNDLKETHLLANRIYKKLSHEFVNLKIGIGTSEKTAMGYRVSYYGALHSLQIIQKLNYTKKFMHINDWGIIKILDTIPEKIKETYLNEFPFLSNNLLELELQGTLEMFLNSNLSVELTSNQLNIHRNTVTYRLDKIKNLCGLNPRNFDDAVQLKILLFFIKMRSNQVKTE
jgi:carbohydrate diacid regulator